MSTYEKDFTADNLTGKNHEGENANTPVKVLTATSIIGDNVENRNGDKLGEIKDIMLNIQKGNIEYVIVQYGGFLGIGEKLFAIPFESLKLDADREVFILNANKEVLEKAPGFDKDHWPETNSQHYGEATVYWGNFMGPNTGTAF